MDLKIQNEVVAPKIDIAALVGQNTAHILSFKGIKVGRDLQLELIPVGDSLLPALAAIDMVREDE